MKALRNLALTILVIIIILILSTVYTVTEGQEVLLTRLGEIVLNPKTGKAEVIRPGLHFKIPFLYQARIFDVRLQTLMVKQSRVLTKEQKYLLVDYYVKWRINDLPLYYTRTGGIKSNAEQLLQQQVNDALREAFGKRNISELLSDERVNLMTLLQTRASETAKSLGIKVVDVGIKSIDLPKEVSESVFARMSTEREQVAAQHRSKGRAEAESIKAQADADVAVAIATAKEEAARMRAEGMAEAATVYNTAYQQDPTFYSFLRSLQVYQQSFDSRQDMLILQPDSQFFRYFNQPNPKTK